MSKRAVDLSAEELAAMGAKAARTAAQQSQSAGLDITGTVTTYERGRATSALAQLHPSGTVTLVRKAGEAPADEMPAAARPDLDKAAD
jgi:uncharacterized membrane protein YgcG